MQAGRKPAVISSRCRAGNRPTVQGVSAPAEVRKDRRGEASAPNQLHTIGFHASRFALAYHPGSAADPTTPRSGSGRKCRQTAMLAGVFLLCCIDTRTRQPLPRRNNPGIEKAPNNDLQGVTVRGSQLILVFAGFFDIAPGHLVNASSPTILDNQESQSGVDAVIRQMHKVAILCIIEL